MFCFITVLLWRVSSAVCCLCAKYIMTFVDSATGHNFQILDFLTTILFLSRTYHSSLKLTRAILFQVIVSTIGLLLFGKLLEPLWGSKELSKFIFIVNFSTSACVFITAIVLYYITQQEIYL